MSRLPTAVQAALWSYDADALDPARDRDLIITNVLAHGTYEAVQWLRATYTETEIRATFESSLASLWSPKTLCYWSLMLHTTPRNTSRAAALV